MMKRLRKILIPLIVMLSAAYLYAAQGIPVTEVSGGIDTDMVVANKIFTIDAGYLNQIREGNIADHTYVNIRGHSHSVITTDQEISALGTPSTTAPFGNWPAAAAGAVIVSTTANDAAAGTGATLIIIRGLEDNAGSWDAATATVVPTGTTPTAATAQTFIRVDEIEVVTSGAGLTNDGDITLSISGVNIIKMYADHSRSDAGRRTVPSGEEMHLQNPEASAIGNKAMTYHVFCRDNTVANSPFLMRSSWHSLDGGYRPNGKLDPFAEKVDMVFIGHAEISGAKASMSVEGWLEIP